MSVKKILSKNAAFQKLEVLKSNRNKRYKYNEFLVEGVRNINEAVRNNWKINSFIYSGEKKLSAWASDLLKNTNTKINFELTDILMDELSKKEETSEIMAVINMKNDGEFPLFITENPIIALFDRPSNKGNLGTMLRSCDAFGINGFIITGHAVDIYDPDVISSSMGSFFNVPFTRLSSNDEINQFISDLKTQYPQIKIVGTTAHKQTRLQDIDLTVPILLLIGNETNGLNRYFTEICDIMATIPMNENSSASSFNVSCAASVIFYEAIRQRC